ncbi:hypothetical protein Q5N45_14580 [Vibrio cholerae]|uniref:hypothetical protein n=1 Tax=Vibrio cholerae TaxID=666 RepID=UPI0001541E1A|nr:hypothetical protein [Vibrio cholerae]KNH52373.1 hypothetical protein A59_4022 [Vibrio cholerae 623-39]MDV2340268.1 hypothetical protein [Vibrio cholerae]BCN19347.1 putative O-antigen flippase [Vibrio cholerae]GIB93396.1 Capsular polysaccharide biosynthesis protein CapF [Vibrio cholerae]
MNTIKLINLSALTSISEKIIQLIGSMLLLSIIAKSLGVEQFGNWQLILTYSSIFSAFCILCAAEIVSPRVVKNLNRKLVLGRIISTIYYLRLFTTTALYASLLLIYYFLTSNSVSEIIIFYILCFSVVINETIASFTILMVSTGKSYIISLARLFSFFIKLTIIYILFKGEVLNVLVLSILWVLESIVTSILILIYFKNKTAVVINKKYFNKKYATCILRRSVFFGLGLGVFILFRKVDKLIFNYYYSDYEFGIYSAASQMIEVLFQLTVVTLSVIAPLTIYRKNIMSLIVDNYVKIIIIYFLCSFFVVYVGFLLFPYIFDMLFPEQYYSGYKYIQIAIWGFPLFFLDYFISLYIVSRRADLFFPIKWILTTIAFIITFYFLKSSMNMLSISYSLVVALMFSLLVTVFKVFNINERL